MVHKNLIRWTLVQMHEWRSEIHWEETKAGARACRMLVAGARLIVGVVSERRAFDEEEATITRFCNPISTKLNFLDLLRAKLRWFVTRQDSS